MRIVIDMMRIYFIKNATKHINFIQKFVCYSSIIIIFVPDKCLRLRAMKKSEVTFLRYYEI